MSLKLSEKASYTPPPAGLHPAVCVWVIDLGLQAGTFGTKPQLLLSWELPDCPDDQGKPHVISRRFTATLSKNGALRPVLASWRGRDFTAEEVAGFDMSKLVGVPCQVLIQHTTKDDGQVSATVQTVIKAAPGQPTLTANPALFYDQDRPDAAVKTQLPEWIQKLLDEAIEPPKPPVKPAETAVPFDDDLAF